MLAAACGVNEGELFGRHAGELLMSLAAEQEQWAGDCPGQKVLSVLMLGSPPEVWLPLFHASTPCMY
jgi:hypothetical protein